MPWHGITKSKALMMLKELEKLLQILIYESLLQRDLLQVKQRHKAAYKLMTIGCDSFYTNNSAKLIKDLRRENVPVISHVGLSAWK